MPPFKNRRKKRKCVEFLDERCHSDGESLRNANVALGLAMEQCGIHKRSNLETLKTSLVNRLPSSITERQYYLEDTDKLFAMQWIDENRIMVGSKCNKLMLLDISNRGRLQYQQVTMPPAPQRSFLLDAHGWGQCGIHCISSNACGDLIATGGSNPADCLILRTSDWSPVSTLVGHRDWVFGAAWVTDRHVVTGSRDQSTALWNISDEDVQDTDRGPTVQEYNYHNPGQMKRKYKGKVREVKYDHELGLIAALSNDGYVVLQDPGVDLKVVRRLNVITKQDLVAMALRRDIVATAGLCVVSLSDPRRREPFAFVDGLRSPDGHFGVRSVCLRDHVLSFGTGVGKIAFWDLRVRKFLQTTLDINPEITNESTADNRRFTGPGTREAFAESPLGVFRPATHAREVAPDFFLPASLEFGLENEEESRLNSSVLLEYPIPNNKEYIQTGKGWLKDFPNFYIERFGPLEGQACYAHDWDPTGTRLFAVGGPLNFGLSGGYIGLFE